ncbi:hypothetical protein QE418_000615 [Microbacterium testaceum]|uniref:hypothetical protein n=1 Tax=Microbacterium TaxID=33882 RepID=UPI00278044EF|nr:MULTISPECIES: hypothetical protein [Microbacterium]MDQ1111167.1 hypothetical protein [Microbacterium testaceum]MDR6098294.1 hypothetical protein [Microbacterium sp. SORGH_AS_0454]
MAGNWPIAADVLGKAIGLTTEQIAAEQEDLAFFAATVCSLIDRDTGRAVDPHRHEIPGVGLPPEFVMSAREWGKLMWNQTKGGTNARGQSAEPTAPAGVGMPAKVAVWLAPFPPRIFYGGGA